MADVLTGDKIEEFVKTGVMPKFEPPAPVVDAPIVIEGNKIVEAAKAEEAPEVDVEDDHGLTKADQELTDKIRKKIGAKHRAMKEAEEFAESQYKERRLAETRAEKLQAQLDELQAKTVPPVVEAQKPKAEDFKTQEDYLDAITEWKVEQKYQQKLQQDADNRAKAEVDRINAEFAKRVAKAREEIPDFVEVAKNADQMVPRYLSDFAMESELGPQLLYHLAKHPAELERLTKLSPIKAIAEMGKLETKLEAKAEPKVEPKPVVAERSRAPAPIEPINQGTGTGNTDPSKARDYDEYRRLRDARKR